MGFRRQLLEVLHRLSLDCAWVSSGFSEIKTEINKVFPQFEGFKRLSVLSWFHRSFARCLEQLVAGFQREGDGDHPELQASLRRCRDVGHPNENRKE